MDDFYYYLVFKNGPFPKDTIQMANHCSKQQNTLKMKFAIAKFYAD